MAAERLAAFRGTKNTTASTGAKKPCHPICGRGGFQPRLGIISAGEDNPYGHPSPELLERLKNAGVRTLRTDRDGAVHVLTDGARLEITCFFACPGAASVAASMRADAPNYQQDKEKK